MKTYWPDTVNQCLIIEDGIHEKVYYDDLDSNDWEEIFIQEENYLIDLCDNVRHQGLLPLSEAIDELVKKPRIRCNLFGQNDLLQNGLHWILNGVPTEDVRAALNELASHEHGPNNIRAIEFMRVAGICYIANGGSSYPMGAILRAYRPHCL